MIEDLLLNNDPLFESVTLNEQSYVEVKIGELLNLSSLQISSSLPSNKG
jgi:hypothetical protein